MAAVDEKKNDKPAEEKASEEVFQWVTFKLENETYGVNVMQVQEVLRYTEIAPVPGAPDYVLGIINLRGNVVTVIDTRLKFGLMPAEITDNSRIIIIEAEKQVVGILVDSVAEVVYLKASEIDDAPSVGTEESARYTTGVRESPTLRRLAERMVYWKVNRKPTKMIRR